MLEHNWAQGWPGNFCIRCGLDDPIESAICCPNCYVPCCDEDMAENPVMKLCPKHQDMLDTKCIDTRMPDIQK